MKRILSIFYNNIPEAILICFLSIPIILLAILEWVNKSQYLKFIILVLCICTYILGFFYERRKLKSTTLNYFALSRSHIFSKYIWVNQKISKNRDQDKCPQKEFMRELYNLKKILPNDKICMCRTHNQIAEIIRSEFTILKDFEAYQDDLKKLKKKLRNKKCKKCNDDCSIMKSDQTVFYAMKFKI